MSQQKQTATRVAPGIKGIVRERESQLRLVTSVRLRWAAVLGQLIAIAVTMGIYGFPMEVGSCLVLVAMSAWLNVYLSIRYPARHRLSTDFATALLAYDTLQLTGLLFFTGGIQNPFSMLLAAPVTVAASTLPPRYTAVLGSLVLACAIFIAVQYYPLPWYQGMRVELPRDYKFGIVAALAAAAGFLAFYSWRLNKESRQMSAALAATDMVLASEQRLHALDGLAAAAAHELGTPLSTLSVILGDWRHLPHFTSDPELHGEVCEMQAQIERCKAIVSGILLSAGKARGEASVATTLGRFLDELLAEWRTTRPAVTLTYVNRFGDDDPPIVSDSAVKQTLHNLLDNALEASPRWIGLDVDRDGDTLVLTVKDTGSGFAPEMLAQFGKPYQSSKGRPGGGLGLFLVVNVVRTLGGTVAARNRSGGGALVTIRLPLSAITLEEPEAHGR